MSNIQAKLAWQLTSIGSSFLSQILLLFLMARYFSAAEAGQVAVFALIIVGGQVFSEGGVSSFVIYKAGLSQSKIIALKAVSIAVGVVILIGLCIAKDLLDAFYNSDFSIISLVAAALTVIACSLASFSQALCLKEGYISVIAKAEIVQKLIFSILVSAALWGRCGAEIVYVFSQLASNFLKLVILDVYVKRRFSSGFEFPDFTVLQEAKEFIFNHFVGQGVNILSSKIDEIMVSKLFSIEILGGYFLLKQSVTQVYYAISIIFKRLYTQQIVSQADAKSFCSAILRKYYFLNFCAFVFCGLVLAFYQQWFLERYRMIDLRVAVGIALFLVLKYVSANMQCYVVTVLGKPMRELYWNGVQFSIVFAATMFFPLTTPSDYVAGLVFCYVLLRVFSIFYFKKYVRSSWWDFIFLIVGLSFLFMHLFLL